MIQTGEQAPDFAGHDGARAALRAARPPGRPLLRSQGGTRSSSRSRTLGAPRLGSDETDVAQREVERRSAAGSRSAPRAARLWPRRRTWTSGPRRRQL